MVMIAKSDAHLLGYAEVEEELGRIRRRMATLLSPVIEP